MPIISSVTCHPFSDLTVDILLSGVVQCPSCKGSRVFSLTLQQLRNIVDDYTTHRDTEGKILWIEGTTRLLTCPHCGFSTVIKIAIHRSKCAIICNEDESLAEWKWVMG